MKTALRIASTADGGYVAGQRFYAYYPDFQGNVHVVASDGEFLQSNHYYPYGLPFAEGVAPKFQPHKYSGKEFLSDRSLNLYDFHARLQDPIIGGFDRMDPCLEDFMDVTPYSYCNSNPIKFIDPTGRVIKFTNTTKEDREFIVTTMNSLSTMYVYSITDDGTLGYTKKSEDSDFTKETNQGMSTFNEIVTLSIDNEKKVSIAIDNNSSEIIAEATKSVIDIADIRNCNYNEVSSTNVFAHELYEQCLFKIFNRSLKNSHLGACNAENLLSGCDIGVVRLIDDTLRTIKVPILRKFPRDSIKQDTIIIPFDINGNIIPKTN